MELVKKVVGIEAFTKVYAASFKQISEKRDARKQEKAALVRELFPHSALLLFICDVKVIVVVATLITSFWQRY